MTTLDSPRAPESRSAARGSGLAGQFAEALAPVVGGELPVHLTLWDGSSAGPVDAPRVVVRSPRALRRLLRHPGELGAAQAYVTGELDVEGDLDHALTHVWSVAQERGLSGIRPTPSVAAGVVRLARNAGVLGRPLPPPASQAVVKGRLHSLRRDRAAISHHYDLSNDFYQLILDPHLAYSCGYWRSDDPDYTVEDAQRDKFELVGHKLGLREGSRLLDVGCGWGSMSLYAAEHFGAQVTGVTIAAEQKRFIDARIRERGLQDRVEIRLQDYRDVPDTGFDAVVSLEMGEHVGQRNYPTYARVLHDAVRPGGRVLVQQMSRRGRHPGGGPFIEQFIAPDMHMRPVGDTVALIEESGLEVRDVHALREHYVRTVDAWHDTFEANWDRAVALVGEEIARVWRLYLVGGSMAFRDGRMGVDQILAVRPGAAGRSDVEPVRPGGWS
ncbi:cyclopropane-fatty-acyl-phospholipid synthase family protein [Phycicoccus sp. M110.8]|uniref:cyclopropane-fatty-acyl-phospholipid synthase family protein n=1 Tax=Phycicoccus sp. M110.8 TaxID=3075433 RepID=UPI0028FD44EC|nr:cyclopropane-fatty-acyl-phospholipid synthase family protein [Phycicoccus sp. M110.8]MDU0314770.1 cyclopropane-fatty-acyl-phospholipid synthase family protein [Phycicoccus sp. M110.8]